MGSPPFFFDAHLTIREKKEEKGSMVFSFFAKKEERSPSLPEI